MQVSEGYFAVVGATPAVGRLLEPEDQVNGRDLVVVLSYGLWQRRFGGDPRVVGRSIILNGRVYTVVGALEAGVPSLPNTLIDAPAELYRPVAEAYDERERDSRHLRAIARLREGVELASARADVDVIARRLVADYPDQDAGSGFNVVPLGEDTVGAVRRALLALLGAVGGVLLIACANVGNLLLARATARRKELAVRAALGASAWRLARMTLTESLLLALLGGVAGVLLAWWGTSLVTTLGAGVIPSLVGVEIDRSVLLYTLAVSALAGLAFGSVPAFHAARANHEEALRGGGRTGTDAHGGRLRSALVVVETALALVLLVCAGLLLRSVALLHDVEPGFDPSHVLTMKVWLPSATYGDGGAQAAFFDRFLERVEVLPAVEAAGVTSVLPVSTNFDSRGIEIEGREYGPGERPSPDAYFVTPDYTRALSIPILSGRSLARSDTGEAPPVALVSESMARVMWPGEDVLGKRFHLVGNGDAERPWCTVVGVASDVHQKALDARPEPAFYLPLAQFPVQNVTLVVKSGESPSAVAAVMRREVAIIDKNQDVFDVETMSEVVDDSIGVRRFAMSLLAAFAVVALALAAVGIYGVLGYTVSLRTREIGVRMALGARGQDVVRLVAGHGLRLTLTGVAAGLCGSYLTTRVLSSLLYGVSTTDPLTFFVTATLLLGVSVIAAVAPATRAARTNPVRALDSE